MPRNLIATCTRLVDPYDLTLDDISIEDIAHALSNQCRYGGHTCDFYSVAEHSVILAEEGWKRWGPAEALFLLLHDAEEAYLQDMAQPTKRRQDFEGYRKACAAASKVIFQKLGVKVSQELALACMHLDEEMVKHEAKAFWQGHIPVEWKKELDLIPSSFNPVFHGWLPLRAEHKFLNMFGRLTYTTVVKDP